MAAIFSDNSLTIGRTPLVQLNRISEGCGARVLAKIEGRNPAYSVKCRIGAAMVAAAERDGLLVAEWPSDSLWAVGTLFGISLFFSGFRLLTTPAEA